MTGLYEAAHRPQWPFTVIARRNRHSPHGRGRARHGRLEIENLPSSQARQGQRTMTVTEIGRAATDDDAAAEERRLRRELAAVYRLIAHFRMTDLVYNHISVRLPGPEHRFLLNPYGLLYEEITA